MAAAALTSAAAGVRVPGDADRVYKEECMFSFYTPHSPGGVYVNMSTWQCFSPAFVGPDVARNGAALASATPGLRGVYLHEQWSKLLKEPSAAAPEGAGAGAAEAEPAGDAAGDGGTPPDAKRARPTKLGIGVEGGVEMEGDKYQTRKDHAIVVLFDSAPAGSGATPSALQPGLEQITVALPLGFAAAKDEAGFDEAGNADKAAEALGLPAVMLEAARAIIGHHDAMKVDAATVAAKAWDPSSELRPSRYAEALEQLPASKKIPASGWKCEESGQTENLWLNLSTGYIGSGRRNWDGSGGTGAALRHFEETGNKYPLVVKLGTITADGADVFSYAPDEGDMVLDPKLKEHLAHWGIDMDAMTKTEKTMEEMELDLNLTYEFDKLTEAGKDLVTLRGKGLVGLTNLGNSCYFNSVMQVMMALPEVGSRYLDSADTAFATAPADPATDFSTQMAKFAKALLTDTYDVVPVDPPEPDEPAPEAAAADSDATGTRTGAAASTEDVELTEPKTKGIAVAPRMLKTLLGAGHEEFSTGRQQDAMEYFQHVLTKMERTERAAGRTGADDVTSNFKFKWEVRHKCDVSGKVRYTQADDSAWSVNIPVQLATNGAEVAAYETALAAYKAEPKETRGKAPEPVPLKLTFDSLLGAFFGDEHIEGFYSSATRANGPATRTTRMATFPNVLALHLRKYIVGPDWRPKKLDTSIDVPQELDLSMFRGKGLQAGEEELPEGSGEAAAGPDDGIVAAVVGMGFSENAGKRAALATSNSGAEAAVNWVMEHMGDPDINDPPADTGGGGGGGGGAVDETSLMMITSMGISAAHATRALQETGGDVQRAAEWAFSHDEADFAGDAAGAGAGAGAPAGPPDGPGTYELIGIVSHMGSSTASGHYVCHIKKDGRWVFFNDRKVAESQEPPIDMGYIYFYRRKAA